MRELINLLLVDDNQDFLYMLNEMLKEEDISLQAAETVVEAEEILNKYDVDAIVCDFNLPESNGIEFLSKIRKAGLQTPFILISGHVTNEVMHNSLRLGAFELVEKPIRFDRLCQVIRHAVNVGIQIRNLQSRIETNLNSDDFKLVANNIKTTAMLRALNHIEAVKKTGLGSDDAA